MSKTSLRRLVTGVGLLALLAALAVGATGTVFAQTASTARLTCAAGSGTATTTSTTACTITPGGDYTLSTDFTFASAAAAASAATPTRLFQLHQSTVAYPRWNHAANTHWFYYIARNVASAAAGFSSVVNVAGEGSRFVIEYYAPPRRTSVAIASAIPGTGAGFASIPAGGNAPIVYAQAGNNAPIVSLTSVSLTSVAPSLATTAGLVSYNLTTSSRWGHGQEWWHAGSVVFHHRAEIANTAAGGGAVTAGAWVNSGNTLTLSNSAPTQTTVGGNRTLPAGTQSQYIITANDTNGDLRKATLRFRRPADAGWFFLGYLAGDDNADIVNTTCGAAQTAVEYDSNLEPYQSVTCGFQLFTTYLGTSNNTTTGAPGSGVTDGGTGGVNDTSTTLTFTITPSTAARGVWNVYAVTEDVHGGTTGEVLIGTLTVT